MTRSRLLVLAALVAAGSAAISGARIEQAPAGKPPGTNYTGPAFTFNKIADGVYHAIGTGSLVVMSNAAIVEGDRDVLVVDSHVSPGGAWALQEELKAITPKPIRWVVNSHYHFDHSHGNQIYGPEVQIIGHDFTRAQMVAGKSQDSPAREFFVGGIPNTIKTLEGRLAAATDEKIRTQIQEQLAIQRNHLAGTNAVKPTPPTLTLSQNMTLHLGSREVRLLFLGRGHTAGDVVVHLPKERIVATGDLLINGPSYMGDAFFTDWIQTMETLKGVEFDTILPGHGRAMTGKAALDHWQPTCAISGHRRRSFTKRGRPGRTPQNRSISGHRRSTIQQSRLPALRPTTPCVARTRFSTEK